MLSGEGPELSEIWIIVEGDTEEYFVKSILKDYLKVKNIFIKPVSIYKAGKGDKKLHRGGHGNCYKNIPLL